MKNGSCRTGKEGARVKERARVGSCRVAWKKREDSRNGRTPAEGEERRRRIVGANDSVYLLPLREEQGEGERWGGNGDEEKRSEQDDPGAHLLLVHNRWEGETTSKKRRHKDRGKEWHIYSRRMRQKGTGRVKNGGCIYPREHKGDQVNAARSADKKTTV